MHILSMSGYVGQVVLMVLRDLSLSVCIMDHGKLEVYVRQRDLFI